MAEADSSLGPSTVTPDHHARAAAAQPSGLEQLQALVNGNGPELAMGRTLGFRLAAIAEGVAEFVGEPTAAFLNPLGTVHGGWACTLLDSALGCAVHSTLAPGERYTTLELKVNLTRPILPGSGTYTARGSIVSRGRRVATSEARLVNRDGKVVAHGTTTCLIMAAEDRAAPGG